MNSELFNLFTYVNDEPATNVIIQRPTAPFIESIDEEIDWKDNFRNVVVELKKYFVLHKKHKNN